jgi:dTDP-4-amino-4,6-dideoxygalactose transaminase
VATDSKLFFPDPFPSASSSEAGAAAIPLGRPELGAEELAAISDALSRLGQGAASKYVGLCEDSLAAVHAPARALMTQSCTAAMELAMLMLDLKPGDEVIMPSFTFTSTANAVALRGAVPVFVDIRPDTLNIDETLIEAAITDRTRAILPVHYAGVACEMDALLEVARRHGVWVVEDAAQGFRASYKGRPLGSIGQLGAISFHQTKNIVAGEGGCLLVSDPGLLDRALIGRDKGTNKVAFQEKRVKQYTWSGLGSAYAMHEVTAALLYAQLGKANRITARRIALWHRYDQILRPLAQAGKVQLPTVPEGCVHNGHIYYVQTPDHAGRDRLMQRLNEAGIGATFHYVPLHSSPAGIRYGRASGSLSQTDDCAGRILRLPLFASLTEDQQDRICDLVASALPED